MLAFRLATITNTRLVGAYLHTYKDTHTEREREREKFIQCSLLYSNNSNSYTIEMKKKLKKELLTALTNLPQL